jgi:hypothetical protein
MWYVLRNQSQYPVEFRILSFGIFLSSSAGLMANIYMKVSMHAIASGVMVAFLLLLGYREDVGMTGYISLSMLLAGLICTSRLIDSDHKPKEIYVGFIIGTLSILTAIFMR